jgi:ketosteroid isomerase-like protein
MTREEALAVLDHLHQAQNTFYAGGDSHELRHVLGPGIEWSVPGHNSISGIYRGYDEVLDYFERRRRIARDTFQLRRRDVLVGAGEKIAAITDGSATVGGLERSWSTVGLYDIADGRVTSCWLLPLDADQFDAIWTT